MKQLCMALIRFYQLAISPHFPPSCRHIPTCSAYALEAFGLYGFWKGLFLTCRRLLRCHPFCPGGYDPVPLPEKKTPAGSSPHSLPPHRCQAMPETTSD